jgi:hypothetical protein
VEVEVEVEVAAAAVSLTARKASIHKKNTTNAYRTSAFSYQYYLIAKKPCQ